MTDKDLIEISSKRKCLKIKTEFSFKRKSNPVFMLFINKDKQQNFK